MKKIVASLAIVLALGSITPASAQVHHHHQHHCRHGHHCHVHHH